MTMFMYITSSLTGSRLAAVSCSKRFLSSAPSSHTPSSMYKWLVESGSLRSDPRQVRVLSDLDRVYRDLVDYEPSRSLSPSSGKGLSGWVNRLPGLGSKKAPKPPKGLYIYGSPGTGKTLLMDTLHDCTRISHKKRVHFNTFMINVHERIHRWRSTRASDSDADPIPPLAHSIGAEAHLLCFDEFQVTDVADAMIIKRLFDKLFTYGVVVVATSNRAPKELYKNGIQRDLFLPFIDQLAEFCDVVNLDTEMDYRTAGVSLSGTFFHPPDAKRSEFEAAFTALIGSSSAKPFVLPVGQGRSMKVKCTSRGVAKFTFDELCNSAVGSADYAAIASEFHTVFVEGVPQFSIESRNVLRRFILLVDELYQNKVRLICLAATAPEDLFKYDSKNDHYDEIFAFQRCLSRLIEMQSKEYSVAGDLHRRKRSA